MMMALSVKSMQLEIVIIMYQTRIDLEKVKIIINSLQDLIIVEYLNTILIFVYTVKEDTR